MKKLLAILVLCLGLVSFFTNVSKAQESTTAKIDESQMYVMITDNIPIKGKKNTSGVFEMRSAIFFNLL